MKRGQLALALACPRPRQSRAPQLFNWPPRRRRYGLALAHRVKCTYRVKPRGRRRRRQCRFYAITLADRQPRCRHHVGRS